MSRKVMPWTYPTIGWERGAFEVVGTATADGGLAGGPR
jgi:hypothetical protein